MTETTEQAVKLDYSTWTYDDHLDMVERLAAQADEMAATKQALSVAAMHRESILQITARAQVHIGLATLKKASTAADVESVLATMPPAKPAAAAPKARARQAGDEAV